MAGVGILEGLAEGGLSGTDRQLNNRAEPTKLPHQVESSHVHQGHGRPLWAGAVVQSDPYPCPICSEEALEGKNGKQGERQLKSGRAATKRHRGRMKTWESGL